MGRSEGERSDLDKEEESSDSEVMIRDGHRWLRRMLRCA